MAGDEILKNTFANDAFPCLIGMPKAKPRSPRLSREGAVRKVVQQHIDDQRAMIPTCPRQSGPSCAISSSVKPSLKYS